MKFIFSDYMAFRDFTNKINKLITGFMKSYDLSKDKRLTQKPAFSLFMNERPGIKQPDVSPTMPLLKYVHDNSPPIKIATMRLRESIFRRGFEWVQKFESKCSECGKEFEDVIQKCDSCGGTKIDLPSKLEINRADKFFKTCHIYDVNKMGKRKLVHLLKEIEDDINIYDDAYIIGIKEYLQDKEGNIELSRLHQIMRGNPVTTRMVADEFGEPGGRWWTCLRHRDVVEEMSDKKCRLCGRKLYEIHYVSVEAGGDSPNNYYIGNEVIHVSKYSPSRLYGFSPIVTLWQYALTLTNMIEYVYRSYTESHLPRGVLAMKTSNPDSAYEFWKDVDDKLQKNPHYIPKMFLEGEGNGTGSGMEFVRFMDTLEEMQYIPVRDEIRRTIAAMYGVTNIFIGDTSGVGGLNAEDTQIDITNMAAESGISIYNDHIMPEILEWLGITDWNYELKSPFEENKQRELNENLSETQIAQSMLNMGFNVELGEKDVFEFKYSGQAQKQQNQGFGSGFDQNISGSNPEGDNFNESDIQASIEKAKIYVKNPNEAPPGSKIQRGPQGSFYYETTPQRSHEEFSNMNKRRRVETLLHSASEHYDNLLEEYKQVKDINPNHALSLQGDLEETRNLIRTLHQNYRELFDDQPEMEKELSGQNININIQKNIVKGLSENDLNDLITKYIGEKQDNRLESEFQKELNRIFDIEIEKVMKNAERFSQVEIKALTKKVLDNAIWNMKLYTNRHLEKIYKEGQNFVGNLIGQSIDFQKVDEQALKAILDKHVLWDSYENLEKSTSDKINHIITESYKDPETFSVQNMVKEMKKIANDETYRLERIARTETHNASQKGRDMAFQKSDPNNENRYIWAVRHDSRTSPICKEIEEIVDD